jgi:hypothetical protein
MGRAFFCTQGIEVGAVLISWGLSKSAQLGGNLINQVNGYNQCIVLFSVITTILTMNN